MNSADNSLGITVSPDAESYFVSFLKTLRARPDKVSRSKYGTSAVWEDVSDRECEDIISFVEKMSDDQYVYERICEYGGEAERILGGDYTLDFGTRLEYVMYGTPIDLDTVMSGNRKGMFGRRR